MVVLKMMNNCTKGSEFGMLKIALRYKYLNTYTLREYPLSWCKNGCHKLFALSHIIVVLCVSGLFYRNQPLTDDGNSNSTLSFNV
jgi:hypothetical protein